MRMAVRNRRLLLGGQRRAHVGLHPLRDPDQLLHAMHRDGAPACGPLPLLLLHLLLRQEDGRRRRHHRWSDGREQAAAGDAHSVSTDEWRRKKGGRKRAEGGRREEGRLCVLLLLPSGTSLLRPPPAPPLGVLAAPRVSADRQPQKWGERERECILRVHGGFCFCAFLLYAALAILRVC